MGNYMETCIQKEKPEDKKEKIHVHEKVREGNQELGKVRVKLVLRKDELEWLLVQIKKKEGKRLEEVLEDIERSRMKGKSVKGWKPSLESIMESPEICHEMDRS